MSDAIQTWPGCNVDLVRAPETDVAENSELVLQIWQAPSGQWSGRLLQAGSEAGAVAGGSSAEDVEHAAVEAGIYPDRVEILENGPRQ